MHNWWFFLDIGSIIFIFESRLKARHQQSLINALILVPRASVSLGHVVDFLSIKISSSTALITLPAEQNVTNWWDNARD